MKTKTIETELKELKSLVRQFMDVIEDVPLRAIDCNQTLAYNLWDKLVEATKAKKVRKRNELD